MTPRPFRAWASRPTTGGARRCTAWRATASPRCFPRPSAWPPPSTSTCWAGSRQAIADEARAKLHAAGARRGAAGRYQGLTFFAPNVNMFRDPRWGRGQETYGEDPFLTARLGVAVSCGARRATTARHLLTAAVAKHFAVHSGPEATRHRFDARVDAHDLRDTYLPQFEAWCARGRWPGSWPAYNRVDGQPCAAHPAAAGEVLRRDWGFGGFVVSDCGAIEDLPRGHAWSPTRRRPRRWRSARGHRPQLRARPIARLSRAVERGPDHRSRRSTGRSCACSPCVSGWACSIRRRRPAGGAAAISGRRLAGAPGAGQEARAESPWCCWRTTACCRWRPRVRRIAVVGPTADDQDVLLGNYNGKPSRR